MSNQYTFLFDARYCSGCKACQAACKDKNTLPPGVLWRRVMEVSGGAWQKDGSSWRNSVFAYNLSISCNHCLHPKCAGICPVNAFVVREDGIVILDETKCMGCGYCAWGCPYGVPQYNPEAGHMSKCDFCVDHLEQGLPPACVAACPLRVLDYRDMTALPAPTADEIRLWESPSDTHPQPLPVSSHTQPRLAIRQHPAMRLPGEKQLANAEEIQPRIASPWEDVPLILFTLLGQLAVGSVWAMAWMFPTLWALVSYNAWKLRLLPVLVIGGCLGLGMLASLAHLGTKKNAWRVFTNLKRSSLSREVFFTLLFGLGLLTICLAVVLHQEMTAGLAFAAAAGLGLVDHMAQVYRLPAAPGWNNWRTNAGFLVSALLLGVSAMTPLLAYEEWMTGIPVSTVLWKAIGVLLVVLFLAQLALMRGRSMQDSLAKTRIGLLLAGMITSATLIYEPGLLINLFGILLFVITAAEEGMGRWLFYRSRI